jgi:hypothetical protein
MNETWVKSQVGTRSLVFNELMPEQGEYIQRLTATHSEKK